VVPLLQEQGHKVHTIDLPSHGADQTPVAQVSLKAYTDRVCEVLDGLDEPAILVGHSMGGIAVSQSAEERPDKVKKLVYVTAFLLRDQECMVDIIQTDAEALVAPNLAVSSDGVYTGINVERVQDIFYGCCKEEDVERAKISLTPQPMNVLSTKLSLTPERYGQIPRTYIECLRDQAITHSCQKGMYIASPCEKVFTIDTDHSPFYSTPEELASILLEVNG
jgi:hypothetical protein